VRGCEGEEYSERESASHSTTMICRLLLMNTRDSRATSGAADLDSFPAKSTRDAFESIPSRGISLRRISGKNLRSSLRDLASRQLRKVGCGDSRTRSYFIK